MTTWYVTLKGNDQWSGTKAKADAKAGDGPFATLTRARDAIREWRRNGGTGPVEVVIDGGNYPMTESFVLGPEDSGTPDAPVTWRAAEGQEVRLSGGLTLSAADFAPVSDPAVAAKLRPEVRERVRQIDLAQRGVSVSGPFTTLGCMFMDTIARLTSE